MASGHMNRVKRPDTWLHRPMLQNVKKVLANPEPSTHDPIPTSALISMRPAVRISHSRAMASGILHTIGPHERHMGRRDFSMLPGGGLRRALPAPQRKSQEPASSRREGHRRQAGCAEQPEEKRHNE